MSRPFQELRRPLPLASESEDQAAFGANGWWAGCSCALCRANQNGGTILGFVDDAPAPHHKCVASTNPRREHICVKCGHPLRESSTPDASTIIADAEVRDRAWVPDPSGAVWSYEDTNPKDTAALRDGKVPLDLIEHAAEVAIAEAMHTGAVKYGRRNYRTIPIFATTYGAAIKRHVGAWLNGEDLDPESGLSHLAHIGANVNVLLGALDAGTFKDDRAPTRDEIQELQSQRSNAQHSGA